MRRRPALPALILLVALVPAPALGQGSGAVDRADAGSPAWLDSLLDRTGASLLVEAEPAVAVDGPHVQKAELSVEPRLTLDLPLDVDLTALGRLRADPYDRLGRDAIDVELRELYLDADPGPVFLRLGRQQVVWGTADGLKVLDVVNPQDFREFILDDFEDSRIPLWMVNAEVPLGPVVAQLLWIPDATFHELPEPGTVFRAASSGFVPRVPPPTEVEILPPDTPDRSPADSDAGARLSSFAGGWDLTVSYLYHYRDMPVFAVESRSAASAQEPARVALRPEYRRSHLLGGTFSRAVGSATVRGEVGLSTDAFLPAADPADRDGYVRASEIGYVLGLDWFGFDATFLSVQLFQTWIVGGAGAVVPDRAQSTASILYRRDWSNERWEVEALWLQSLYWAGGMLRPEITYELESNVTVWAGVDAFYGPAGGLFGRFDASDRVVVGTEWGL